MSKTKTVNILLGGEAGQGLLTLGNTLTKVLVRSGYHVVVTQTYMSRVRGGHNTFLIRASTNGIQAPREAVDILAALTEETVELHKQQLSDEGKLICNASWDYTGTNRLAVPYEALAKTRYENTVALGIVSCLLGLKEALVAQSIEEQIGKKHPEQLQPNKDALQAAYRWTRSQSETGYELPEIAVDEKRLAVNGNEAIALGALAAGVRFCSFYPMTPATSVALTLIQHSEKMGVVVEQAEDEIAAINMALGASFAGVPAIVPTSGGGFALMCEGVSLAGITETPIVVVVAQRPGPATGLPTRTEQGDLEFVLHGGHGEFPRVVFAPGSIEECFDLAYKAVRLADRYQLPVFILTDQFLSSSTRSVKRFSLEGLEPVVPCLSEVSYTEPYRRFELTDDGISGRLIPGITKNLVLADSDEHTEEGKITEDYQVRTRMVQKRLRKLQAIASDVLPPTFYGDEQAEVLLVCWGSSKGSAFEAIEKLREGGKQAACLHFSQVWPLVPELFLDRLDKAKEVVCVEGNATGQFARLIRRETGFEIKKRCLRYDGQIQTPESILRSLSVGESEVCNG